MSARKRHLGPLLNACHWPGLACRAAGAELVSQSPRLGDGDREIGVSHKTEGLDTRNGPVKGEEQSLVAVGREGKPAVESEPGGTCGLVNA
jgi:hypothetical protein